MKPPYFKVTAQCDSDRCKTGDFTAERKQVTKKSTSGQPYTINRLVCPQCKCWGYVLKIEEVTA